MRMKIACIGVGNLGRAWATIFARAGHEVALYDSAPEVAPAAFAAIRDTLSGMAEADLVEDVAGTMARIRVCNTLADALNGAEHVQESVIEDIDDYPNIRL